MIIYNQTFNLILKKLVATLPIIYGRQLKTKHPNVLAMICKELSHSEVTAHMLLSYIDECTKDFILDYDFNYKMYWVLAEFQDYPTCINGHRIEPKKNFRMRVNPQTLEVSSNLAQKCNDPHCAQTNPVTIQNRIAYFQKTFGVDNPWQSPAIIAKIEQTNLERYGYKHAAQSPYIKELSKQRCLEKYGVTNCWNLPKVKEILNDPAIQAKRLESLKAHNQACYGVDWFVQSDQFKEMTKTINGSSKEEKQIVQWLKTFIPEIDLKIGTFRIIPPRQLDVYIESKKIGIEFNGTYYHSIEHNTDVLYHLNKTKLCEENGIRLIHVWEDEWNTSNDQIKQFIANVIDGTLLIESYLKQCEDGTFEVDRSKFNKCSIPSTYKIIGETPPEIILRCKASKDKYRVADCGKLILRRTTNVDNDALKLAITEDDCHSALRQHFPSFPR